ncbi:MAG: FAD-dependent oxidoreductase [Planctomycetota bacterium]
MLISQAVSRRELQTRSLTADLVVVGGGLAGACGAIAAARAGVKVVLIQDRPVLGGNASSEVRLWVLGATSHMGNNNRWAREGGVIDELLTENLYRNPEGNSLIFDTVLLEKCTLEPNLTLLLNTSVFEATKSGADTIASVRAWCSQNSVMYDVSAPLFCDASGDGVLGFLAGAAFRMGAESAEEFGEGFAPDDAYGELLGHSMYFYTKDVGRPVAFVPPSYALDDITKIPRYRSFNTKEHGCQLWWIEYGGRLDTVHETEAIKWELWKVIYGVWNHIKNSGEFPEAETLTLEWVGQVPGKRESRRFEGSHMITQRDLIEQRHFEDTVSFGGWAIDLHPADGVFSEKPGCTQWHSKGVYGIPYRCMVSQNVSNLFLAGRIISATHVAFGSTRVMGTCAHGAQAVGEAAALCLEDRCLPREVVQPQRMARLHRRLARTGQFMPGITVDDPEDLAANAQVSASSVLTLERLPAGNDAESLDVARGMLLPLTAGPVPMLRFALQVNRPTKLIAELWGSLKPGNFTPDEPLGRCVIALDPADTTETTASGLGYQWVEVPFDAVVARNRYVLASLQANDDVSVLTSDIRLTGVLSVMHKANAAVSKGGAEQTPPEYIGVERFPFWLPQRRPGGKNLALRISPGLQGFAANQVTTGPDRPVDAAHAWVAAIQDAEPWLELTWDAPQTISRVMVSLDPDFDHPMESALMGHPERVVPFCIRRARLLDDAGRTLAELTDNHQGRWVVGFAKAVTTRSLRLICERPSADVPAAVFRVRCFTD